MTQQTRAKRKRLKAKIGAPQKMPPARTFGDMLREYVPGLLEERYEKREYLLSAWGLTAGKTEETKMAEQQAYAEKMAKAQEIQAKVHAQVAAQAQEIQAKVHAQVAAQVLSWKQEVAGGNHLIGMMLSETHPNIVTYDFLFHQHFGPTPVLPNFHWHDQKTPDPELEAEAAKAQAKAEGISEAEMMVMLALAEAAQAGDKKKMTEDEIKAAMLEAAEAAKRKGGMSPTDRDELSARLVKLEKQKAEWERKEREIAQSFRGGSAGGPGRAVPYEFSAGGDGSGVGSGGAFKSSEGTKITPETKFYPANQKVVLQFRTGGPNGLVAMDALVAPAREFSPQEFNGPLDTRALDKVATGTMQVGDFEEHASRMKASPEPSQRLIKFLQDAGGKAFRVISAREAGAYLLLQVVG